MSGVSGSVGLSAGVELRGHLIDSLTLSKVIDLVQQLGGDYQLNDIRVGSLKKDISAINMTLHASNQQVMDQLLAAIAPYGAVVGGDQEEPQTVTCEQAGQLPSAAFGLKLPKRVYCQGGWQDVSNGGLSALVLEGGTPRIKPVAELKPGDVLVSGTHGLQW